MRTPIAQTPHDGGAVCYVLRASWHPGHTAFCGVSQSSFLKDESILHRERPMNVIFYLSQSVDIGIFVFDTHL